nr:MAG TPA: hypothetical protein [Caudoviricetes sp.]
MYCISMKSTSYLNIVFHTNKKAICPAIFPCRAFFYYFLFFISRCNLL